MKYPRLLFCFLSLFLFVPFSASAVDYDYHIDSITVSGDPTINKDVDVKVKVYNYSTEPLITMDVVNDYSINFDNFRLSSVTLPTISSTSPIDVLEYFEYIITGRFIDFDGSKLIFNFNTQNIPFEANRANNTYSEIINVISAQDTSVNEIEVIPEKPAVDEIVIIKVKIKNGGDIALSSTFGVNDFLRNFQDFEETDPFTFSTFRDNIFNKDQEFIYTYRGKFKSIGTKELKFTIDATDSIKEINETNNTLANNIEVIGKESLDVTLHQIKLPDKDILYNTVLDIKASIRNGGSVALSDPTGISIDSLKYSIPGFVVSSISQDSYPTASDPFKPTDIFNYVFRGWFNQTGNIDVSFMIDKYDYLDESDEVNNLATSTLTVYVNQEAADAIVISDVSVNPISSTSVEILWKTDREATSEVRYNKYRFGSFDRYKIPENVPNDIWPNNTSATIDHAVTIVELDSNASYDFEVNSTRGSVKTFSPVGHFETPPTDNVSINNVNIYPNKDDKSATITWKTSYLADSNVYYSEVGKNDYIFVGTADPTMNHAIKLQNLKPVEYNYYVESKNSKIASSTKSAIYSFSMVSLVKEIIIAPESEKPAMKIINEQEKDVLLVTNGSLFQKLKGRILLKVEDEGEAWYVSPDDAKKYYLGRPRDAFNVMRTFGVGITNANLQKIQVGDRYTPKMARDGLDYNFTKKNSGKIFIAVEANGEAWYVNPIDLKRYYLGRPQDAFQIMRELSTGITNEDFIRL
ncbi:hypothetical protein ISS03_00730 [Patescibacteria group bacterium]|nr:hypothetical protein [Patescibacteria group bacterium]